PNGPNRLGASLITGARDVRFRRRRRDDLSRQFDPAPFFGNGRPLRRSLRFKGTDFQFIEPASLLGRGKPRLNSSRYRVIGSSNLIQVGDLLPRERVVQGAGEDGLLLPQPLQIVEARRDVPGDV